MTVVIGIFALGLTAFAATFTLDQIAAHNSQKDCYLLIAGKVYDVTSYIYDHPGGADYIINFCGVDSTEAYNTKGGKGVPHSSAADADLSGFYIGDLSADPKVNNQKDTNVAAEIPATTGSKVVAEAPASTGNNQSNASVSVKAGSDYSTRPAPANGGLTGRYPLLIPIFLVWLGFALLYWILSKKFKASVNKLLLMRITSLTMLICFLMVGFGGVYMAFFGRMYMNGFDTIIFHVYFGFAFVLAALTHLSIHLREIANYIGQLFKK